MDQSKITELSQLEISLLNKMNNTIYIVTKQLLYQEPVHYSYIALQEYLDDFSRLHNFVNCSVLKECFQTLIKLLAPFFWETSSRIWKRSFNTDLGKEKWPDFIIDEKLDIYNFINSYEVQAAERKEQ